jgi:hypothetical protein
MYLPGSRTVRRLSLDVLQPAFRVMDSTGCSTAIEGLRRALANAYLESQRQRNATMGYPEAELESARLAVELSESSGYFFSRNLVSNESESLAAASHLRALPSGLTHLGVGPETMLSYLGLLETSLGFIVDIRRDNARLHYLYRGAFAQARSRTEWLSLLLARPYDPTNDAGPSASIDEVIAAVSASRPTKNSFEFAHRHVLDAVDRWPPCLLPLDRRVMRQIHRAFWSYGLDISFQLEGLRLRRYPTLASLISGSTPEGEKLGFLANETTFRRIQRLEAVGGVVPIVGSVTGPVLERVADELHRRGTQLGALYLSNVEQYLFENGVWHRWISKLRKLPIHPEAILIRSYFQNEQGPVPDPPKSLFGQLRRTLEVANQVRRNEGPLALHQMKTVVHSARAFLDQEQTRGYSGYRELVCDRNIAL